MSVAATNKYRQVPVVRAEAEKPKAALTKPPPNLKVGGLAVCSHKPLFERITNPCKVIDIQHHIGFVSHWVVTVDTSLGYKEYDSYYFKPFEP